MKRISETAKGAKNAKEAGVEIFFLAALAILAVPFATRAFAVEFTADSLRPQENVCGGLVDVHLSASGGPAPYTFKLESGQLPSGVGLSKDGVISGSPKDSGIFESTIQVTDSAGASAKGELKFTIDLPRALPPLAEDSPGAKWHKPGWAMTFHDEFDGEKIDREKWSFRYTTIPSLCVLENGIGHLRFEKDFPPAPPKQNQRISGLESRRCTKGLAQQYGFFELRAKCHKGAGGQCAFWLSPVDGRYMRVKSADGNGTRGSLDEVNEIDIFEQQGNEPNGNNFTIHYGDDGPHAGSSARHVIFPFDSSADFHVYALDWNDKSVTWYVDGQQVHRTTKTPRNPFFIRLGIYEGDSDWSGKLDRSAAYPKDFDLDYIRVYRKIPESNSP